MTITCELACRLHKQALFLRQNMVMPKCMRRLQLMLTLTRHLMRLLSLRSSKQQQCHLLAMDSPMVEEEMLTQMMTWKMMRWA